MKKLKTAGICLTASSIVSLAASLAGGLSMVTATGAWASDAETSVTTASPVSNRIAKRLGAGLALGEPSPALVGINVAYNVFDFMRATAGYGSISVTSGVSMNGQSIQSTESTATTIGVGTVFMVPGWSLTPTGGLHFANVSYSGTPGSISVGGFNQSGSHLYLSAGADWQAASGLNLGLGLNQSLKSGIGTSFYLSAGWFFNLFG